MEILILIAIIVILSSLSFWLYRKVNQQSQLIQDLRVEGERWRIYPSAQVIQKAEEQAGQIIQTAEVSAIKTEAEKTMEAGLFTEELKKRVEAEIKTITQSLNQSSLFATQKHNEFLLQLQKQNLNWQNTLEEEIRTKTNQLLESFETKLTDFLTGAQKQSLEAINLEIKSARELIDSYKSQQISLVDENIIAVLERSLNIVLNKKLSLKDQMDLVYQALEKAKLEKFLI